MCGFDAVVVKGKASGLVYLVVEDGKARIEDAADCIDMDTKEFQDKMHEQYSKSKVIQIGPAGIKQGLLANITNDLSFFNGRNGLGAVMGSKNLRGIVAAPSKTRVEVPDKETLTQTAKQIASRVKEHPLSKALNDLGTAAGVVAVNAGGSLPTRNWQDCQFDEAENLGGENLRDHYLQKRHGCFGCAIRCKRVVKISQNNIDVDPAFGGPEYESLGTLGSMCGVGDMPVVCKANELCNRWGLDTISLGATIAFAMQCFEEGLITKEDVGYDLSFGNGESLLRMIEDVAFLRGFGAVLAEGSYRAAEKIGGKAKEYIHVTRKQELPMHDPRVKTGLGLQYALSARGADHWVAQHDPFFAAEDSPGVKELAGLGLDRPVPKVDLSPNKVRFFYITNILCSAYDILGVCTLAAVGRSLMTLDEILTMVRAATGWNTTWYEIMKVGERVGNLARVCNVEAGVGAEEDKLPKLFTKNINGGPNYGTGAINEAQFDDAVKMFYKMAGWTEEGVPTKSKLDELEIV
jgi:aldehyde:ferredoxin oxidoreductase